MLPATTIRLFDAFLIERRLSLEAVVIGGTALGLLGVATRHTKDCDILHPDLPAEVRAAAAAFAVEVRATGEPLADDWLNNGPFSLIDDLPGGWMERLVLVFEGQALVLRTLGRPDLLKSKVFALCDRGIDLQDCVALSPSRAELSELLPWLESRDTNPGWPEHVRGVIADLARRLGDAV